MAATLGGMRNLWTRINGWIRPLPDAALREDLIRLQYQALKSRTLIMYSVLLVQLAAWMCGTMGRVSPIVAIYVPLILTAAVVARMWVWRRRRGDMPDAVRVRRQIRTTIFLSWLISFVLGGYGISILLLAPATEYAFALLLVCLASVAGAYCLAMVPAAAMPTVMVGALPNGLVLLASDDRMLVAIGADLVVTCLIVMGMVIAQYNDFVGNLIAQSREKQMAHSDALTSLPNRRAFMEHLQDKVALACPEDHFALLMIDLNGFKPINDNYGHGFGDQVLVQIAQRLTRIGPSEAFTARLGGDEFAIIVPDIASSCLAKEYARNVLGIFDRPFIIEGVTVSLSASIGIARYPDHAQDEIALLANADLALYRGKRGGGSPIILYDRTIKAQTRRAMQLEQSMGVSDGIADMELVYQPIVAMGSGEILRLEALARWKDPLLGDVNPPEFIGAAERTGKVSRISERIFDTALLAASAWPCHVGLSINLSAAQLSNPSLPLMLAKLLDFYRFNPARLEIELTETAFLRNLETSKLTVGLLRDIGVRIVLDNFGAGYASVGYLKEMAFDHVKIDGRLIREIDHSPSTRLLVAGVLQLCGAMNIQCTAEQVEREEQLDLLRQLDCARGQGYLFGRPMTGGAVLQALNPPDPARQYSALLAYGDAKKAV